MTRLLGRWFWTGVAACLVLVGVAATVAFAALRNEDSPQVRFGTFEPVGQPSQVLIEGRVRVVDSCLVIGDEGPVLLALPAGRSFAADDGVTVDGVTIRVGDAHRFGGRPASGPVDWTVPAPRDCDGKFEAFLVESVVS